MIKFYLLKKLFIPILLIAAIFSIAQNSYVQNKLINAFLPSGYSVNISKTAGFFPFRFSTENVKVTSKDFDVNIKDINLRISKKLTHIKNIDINEVEIKTNNSKRSIKESLKNIRFYYDKEKAENHISLDSHYGKLSASWTSETPRDVNLDYIFKDQKVNFKGKLINNRSLKGILTLPYGITCESNMTLENNILKIDLDNKKFGVSISVRVDPTGFVIFVDKVNFRNMIKLKPFVIKDFSKISDIIMFLKKGMIKISGINLSKDAFSLGNFVFQNIDLSQFQELGCSGILQGSAEYKDNKELIKLKIKDIEYESIKIQSAKLDAIYNKNSVEGQGVFNISELKNHVNFKISLQNWLPSDSSKIEGNSKGALQIANYKLPKKQTLNGDISYNIKADGNLTDPDFSGDFFLKKGSYINPIYGIYIKNISLNGKISKSNLVINSIYAEDDSKKKGNIKGSGKINWRNSGNTHISLKINNLKLIDQNYLKGRLFGDLNLKGNDLKNLSITGKLHTDNPVLDVSGIILLASRNIDILDNVYSVEKPLEHEQNNTSFPVKIPVNIEFKFNPELKIVGFGIDSTWEGGAIINGNIPDIKYEMNIKMKQGKIDLIDNSIFKLKDGIILINNSKSDISLSAEKKVEKIVVGARFRQIDNSSKVSFYSTPYLSDKDIMSYILFDKPTSEISTGEGLILFSTMNKLSGRSNLDIFNKIKSIFGIDSISIKRNVDSNKEEYNAISLGKKIGKFKVSVDQRDAKGTTGVVVETKIAKNMKMSVDLTGRDAATAGILWNKRY